MKTEALKKLFKATSYDLKENQFSCVASTTGNMDRTGDVIMPGAFKAAVLRDCEQNGWVDVGHGWEGMPIAMPDSLKMQGDELIATATFHSTEDGQEARTVVTERLEAGKSVSVSIGFMPDYGTCVEFESGEEMLKWLEEAGHDMSQFDSVGIKAWKRWCRLITTIKELFEWSIVAIGANQRAKALAVKQFTGDEDDRGLTLAESLMRALGAAEDITDRLEEVKAIRESEGKQISKAHEPRIAALIERLAEIQKAIQPDEPVQGPNPAETAARLRLLTLKAAA